MAQCACTSGKEKRGSVVFGWRERGGVWRRNKRRLNLPIGRYRIDVLMHNAFCTLHTTVEDRSNSTDLLTQTTKGVI